MRQGQQNRRGRGRSNNNNNSNSNQGHSHNNGRKPQNPLARNYESSGPDVKIRGTAAQVAEKYMALARDASSSGDPVLAENYLQHAEHYNRIIMAAQAQVAPVHQHHQHVGEQGHGMNGQHRPYVDGQPPMMREQPPQPVVIEQPSQVAIPGLEPQPEIVEAAPQPEETAGASAADAAAPREGDAGRPRRRRRYPAGGASRAAGAAEPAAGANGAHSGSANGVDGTSENRPPDEALAN
jgi:hypothetical protein